MSTLESATTKAAKGVATASTIFPTSAATPFPTHNPRPVFFTANNSTTKTTTTVETITTTTTPTAGQSCNPIPGKYCSYYRRIRLHQSVETCRTECTKSKTCAFFSFHAQRGVCLLSTATCTMKNHPKITFYKNCESTTATTTKTTTNIRLPNVCTGGQGKFCSSYRTIPSQTIDGCQKLCNTNTECFSFSMDVSRGTCFLSGKQCNIKRNARLTYYNPRCTFELGSRKMEVTNQANLREFISRTFARKTPSVPKEPTRETYNQMVEHNNCIIKLYNMCTSFYCDRKCSLGYSCDRCYCTQQELDKCPPLPVMLT